MRGGDRPKNAHHEFDGVSVMPRSQWEPWVVLRRPLEGRVQDNLRKWKTGGFRRPNKEQPFGDVIRSNPTPRKERKIAPHPSLEPQEFLRAVVRAVLPLGDPQRDAVTSPSADCIPDLFDIHAQVSGNEPVEILLKFVRIVRHQSVDVLRDAVARSVFLRCLATEIFFGTSIDFQSGIERKHRTNRLWEQIVNNTLTARKGRRDGNRDHWGSIEPPLAGSRPLRLGEA
jgi:hypothetical protein